MRSERVRKVKKKPEPRRVTAPWNRLDLLTRDRRLREIQGKYAWIPFSSDDFIAEKHREIEREK